MSAADAITVVAALVFIAGLIAIWQLISSTFAHQYVFDLSVFLNVFGIAAGPALLKRTGPGYWTSLIIFTANAILAVAGLVVMFFLAWEKFIGSFAPWTFLDSGSTAIIVVGMILSLWATLTLRRRDVRGIFGM
jgi:hypothetical protein